MGIWVSCLAFSDPMFPGLLVPGVGFRESTGGYSNKHSCEKNLAADKHYMARLSPEIQGRDVTNRRVLTAQIVAQKQRTVFGQ